MRRRPLRWAEAIKGQPIQGACHSGHHPSFEGVDRRLRDRPAPGRVESAGRCEPSRRRCPSSRSDRRSPGVAARSGLSQAADLCVERAQGGLADPTGFTPRAPGRRGRRLRPGRNGGSSRSGAGSPRRDPARPKADLLAWSPGKSGLPEGARLAASGAWGPPAIDWSSLLVDRRMGWDPWSYCIPPPGAT